MARDPVTADPGGPPRPWAELALGVLRRSGALGEDATPAQAEERLRTELPDGFSVRALYTSPGTAPAPGFPGETPYVRGGRASGHVVGGCDVRQLHDDPDVEATSAALLDDLEHGVRSLWLRVGEGAVPAASLAEVLGDVFLEAAPVVLEARPGAEAQRVARAFLSLAAGRGVAPGELLGTLGLDPLGAEAREGVAQDVDAVVAMAVDIAGRHPRVRPLVVDALPYVEAGATDTEELGCAMATGIAYLRGLTDAGLPVAAAAACLEFRLAGGTDQFLTIAKLRAARRLWARVTEVAGGGAPMQVHAVSSPAMLTRVDPWVNLLRVTAATVGAIAGGADAVTALPFDRAVGRSDAFARRVARNTLALLQDESELAAVVDPAGGSWYVEQLTDQVAGAAWAWMQELERAGGQQAALRSGLVARRLERSRTARLERIRHRHDPVTGVSEFPDLEEREIARPPRAPAAGGGLPSVRYAEPFEVLRDRAERHRAASGARPTAFLATLGPLARHNARATFAANLLAAGGIAAAPAGATTTVDDVVAAYWSQPSAVAVVCGADADYAERGTATATALRDAGARLVALAGRPGPEEAAWREAGIERFLFRGGDALADLEALLGALGVG